MEIRGNKWRTDNSAAAQKLWRTGSTFAEGKVAEWRIFRAHLTYAVF